MGGETTIQSAPTTPAPSASESSEDLYKAKLKYDPQTAASDWAIQQEYVPKQAELYSALYNQYSNSLAKAQQATQQELYPTQSKLLETGSADVLQRLQNPQYMTEAEQAATNAERVLATQNLQNSMRTQANLGGGLYGGRTQAAEAKSVGSLQNQFAQQDYTNRMNQSAQTQNDLTKYLQILYPQVGSQGTNAVNQYQYSTATPSADTLYNAMYGASQPQQYASQSTDYLSQLLGIGGGLGAAAIMSSNRYKKNIKLWE